MPSTRPSTIPCHHVSTPPSSGGDHSGRTRARPPALREDVLSLIHQFQPSDDSLRRQDCAGGGDGIGTHAGIVAEDGAELVNAGRDPLAVDQDEDLFVVAFVAVVGDDGAGLDIDAPPDDRIADEVEVRRLAAGVDETRLDLARWADDNLAFQPDAAAQVGIGCDETIRAMMQGAFRIAPSSTIAVSWIATSSFMR